MVVKGRGIVGFSTVEVFVWGCFVCVDRGEVDYVVPMFDIHCVCSSPFKLKFRFRDDTIVFVFG